MLLTDLNEGNRLQNKISDINNIIDGYNLLHTTQGVQATTVTFYFSDFGKFTFYDHSDGISIVDNLAATFIANITTYRNQLQVQFDALGNGGEA